MLRKRIVAVGKDSVKVDNGDWVQLSDKLRIMGVVPKVNDTAIIKDFKGGRVVIDIITNTGFIVGDEKELMKQKMEFTDILGGY